MINNLSDKHMLADWQQKKAAVYKREEDSLRSIAASLLINAVIFDGLPASPPIIGNYGKPFYEGGPEFNVSHAGDFAVLAVSDLPVGIDIEKKAEEDYLSLGKEFLCDKEYNLLMGSSDVPSLFYELWTRKESYLKMTGKGLLQDPKTVCILHDTSHYRFHIRQLFPGYAVAVCSADPSCAEEFIRLNF